MIDLMRIPLLMTLVVSIGSCDPSETEVVESPEAAQLSGLLASVPSDHGVAEAVDPIPLHPRRAMEPAPAPPANPWSRTPYECETFTVYEAERSVWSKTLKRKVYPANYRRNRHKLTYGDQRKNYALARMVAKEMGFDPVLVEMHADHEASGRPDIIHILSNDRKANRDAWSKYSYSPHKEAALVDKMKGHSVKDRQYWVIKAELFNVRRYKGNPHWNTFLKYERHVPERPPVPAEMWEESQSVWSYGYGLYGMNAVLYTHVWDSQAPPWVMCADQGIVATIMYVWVARDAKPKCDQLSKKDPDKYTSDGGSNRGIIRRMAKGQCGKGRLGPVWRRLMKEYSAKYGTDWEAAAQVGTKWPGWEMYPNGKYKRDAEGRKIPTDRKKILEHMRAKAMRLGLLRSYARPEGSAPKLVRR
jgi:hypothetical protein